MMLCDKSILFKTMFHTYFQNVLGHFKETELTVLALCCVVTLIEFITLEGDSQLCTASVNQTEGICSEHWKTHHK